MEIMTHYEQLGEVAYDAMYEASPTMVKHYFEDAYGNFSKAIHAAKSAGLEPDAARLTARLDHVTFVYNHQFRSVGL